ncbi:MAG: hypothetical protein AAGA85_18090 [Bacteroidota bacterium]
MRVVIYTLILLTLIACEGNQRFTLSPKDRELFDLAKKNGAQAREGYARCKAFVEAWLTYSDSASLLIPRNLDSSIDFWNAKDAAADNYPFMVLTSYFVDRDQFEGRMLAMLKSEKRLTSRVNSLPDTYSFSKAGFLHEELRMGEIVFGTSEYVKDGLLPLTEWLGQSPWSDRMIEMLYDLKKEMTVAGDIQEPGFGSAPKEEVNGELLQVLSRIYWMTGDEELLDWAVAIGDHYLLEDHHPTQDLDYLRLRDHGCELISGLCELYITTHFARPDKKNSYQQPLYAMLDRILEVGRNEDGFFYDAINPQTGAIIHSRIADNWGYTLNGYYAIYQIDQVQAYKAPLLELFGNLDKYRNHDWEGNADGYADAIESALNLYNRIANPQVAAWIDSEIQVMWAMQQESGIVEGWHGDGNFARTTIMHNLWKTKGAYALPWREDLIIGAEQKGDSLLIALQAEEPWEGQVYFDKQRHRDHMKLPMDWPRINQFPEWFTVSDDRPYTVVDLTGEQVDVVSGEQLAGGLDVSFEGEKALVIY